MKAALAAGAVSGLPLAWSDLRTKRHVLDVVESCIRARGGRRSIMRTHRTLLALGTFLLGAPNAAHAQEAGSLRRSFAVEPYYVYTQYDPGYATPGRMGTNGFGGRLWVNVAPFSTSRGLSLTSLSLFAHGSPKKDGWGTLHYGAAVDQFLTPRPLGGYIDPLVSLGAGGYQTRTDLFVRNAAGQSVFGATDKRTRFAITPGVGIRIPIPNRLELRADARKAYMVNARGADRGRRTLSHNEYTAALGITF